MPSHTDPSLSHPDSDRIAEYEIDADQLGIPDTDYDASVTMPSAEFGRIVRDLSLLGESVRIEVSKQGIRFVSDGEAADGNILIKQSAEACSGGKKNGSSSKHKGGDVDDDDKDDEPEQEEGVEASDREGGKRKIKKVKVKKEENGEDVEMNMNGADDDDGGEGEIKATKNEDDERKRNRASARGRRRGMTAVGVPKLGAVSAPVLVVAVIKAVPALQRERCCSSS